MNSILHNKEIRKWSIPIVTLVLTLLSYGLLSPALRFYLDDWPQLYSLLIRGVEGIKQYYVFDSRPYAYWIYVFLFRILGTKALAWHLVNYALRWITALFLWRIVARIWPGHKREAGWIAIFFVIYPLFTQQSISLMFMAHWTCYLLFTISLYLMVLAVQNRKFTIPLLILSMLVNIPNLFTLEYFIGIEFIRPLFLWFSLKPQNDKRKCYRKTLVYWLPFLVLAIFYIFWRVFLLHNLRDENTPILVTSFVHQPWSTSLLMLNYLFKDTVQVILGVWYSTLDPNTFDFASIWKIVSLVLITICLLVSLFILKNAKSDDREHLDHQKDGFYKEMTLLGLTGIILGLVPGWLIMRTFSDPTGIWNDRFGLSAIFGACLFVVGLIGLLIPKNQKSREIFMAVLISLAVGRNFIITAEYKESGESQNQFFSQLKWRAPYIESRTPIYSDNEFFNKMGVYPTAFAFNLAYPGVELMPRTDYWFYQLHKFSSDDISAMTKGELIEAVKWYIYFEAESQNGLVLAWDPALSHCLWVLDDQDRYNPLISTNTRQALALSNLSRIDPLADDHLFAPDLFGRENRNTWCYYFEKADLAAQTGEWQVITNLYDEAQTKGFSTSNGVELLPFIQAYARTGETQKAYQITLEANQKTDNLSPFLCDNWNQLAAELNNNKELQEVYQQFSSQYSCAVYKD